MEAQFLHLSLDITLLPASKNANEAGEGTVSGTEPGTLCGAQSVVTTLSSPFPCSPPSFPLPCARCPDLLKDPASDLPLKERCRSVPCSLHHTAPSPPSGPQRTQVGNLGGKLSSPPHSSGVTYLVPQTSCKPPALARGAFPFAPGVRHVCPLTGRLPLWTMSSRRAGLLSSSRIE